MEKGGGRICLREEPREEKPLRATTGNLLGACGELPVGTDLLTHPVCFQEHL